MTKFIILALFFFTHQVSAEAPPEAVKTRGCLVNLNKKSLGIDPSCKCKETNICFKFNPVKQSEELLGVTEKNGRAVYSQDFKTKSRESASVFNQIIALKAEGKGSSAEIKELYVKLDKLNSAVRKNLLTNHSKHFSQIKSGYQKQLSTASQRETKLKDRIAKYLGDPKSQLDSIKSSIAASSANKTNPAPSSDTQEPSKEKEVVGGTSTTSSENFNSSSAMLANLPVYNSEILEQDKAKEMSKMLEQMDLERTDDDSIFDIITKRYIKTYPNLLND